MSYNLAVLALGYELKKKKKKKKEETKYLLPWHPNSGKTFLLV